jgi:hypothetical protein
VHFRLMPRVLRRPLAVPLLVLVALSLGLGAAGRAAAQQAAMYPLTVTQNRVPGATGQVTITPLPNNQLQVDIHITGLPPTPSSRAAHIHTAQGAVCDNNAPVTYPLSNVTVDASGNGTSSSVVTLLADKPITANNAYVNIHEQASPPGQGVICANITQSYPMQASGSTATTTTTTTTTPATTSAAAPASLTLAPTTTTTSTTTTATSTSTSAASTAPKPTGPGGCWLYDSWCMYCATHAGSDACKQYPPK